MKGALHVLWNKGIGIVRGSNDRYYLLTIVISIIRVSW